MGKTLSEIVEKLANSHKKVQLIYGFNGTGKTRLSREFKKYISKENKKINIIYYNAFTEDLFYWDNDLENNQEFKIKIHSNNFTNWIFKEQGKENEVVKHFQYYTNNKLTPNFNNDYNEITFSLDRGDEREKEYIKISKGEESVLIWSIFYSLIELIIDVLDVAEPSDRETDEFDYLEYIFIDDPVTSLDENHLIELAVNLATLIRSSESEKLKFIITTHNPLFYNVLCNELKKAKKYLMLKNEDETYELKEYNKDAPFSYHVFLLNELKKAIETDNIKKYHFNFLRNIFEKTSTFLGYDNWKELLSKFEGDAEAYWNRIINLSSHSKHSGDEISELKDLEKKVLKNLFNQTIEKYHFNIKE
ncbi:anticodon nuclease [Caminibacter mediatlanticus TB-2]|uniref:Anticodon nuclease n=1 Tax=Caminibacter mediatlanticus TB-2 TaxID=391592 RepID=A0ABX5VAZ8_9BACT|nr:AAA family ATPase [Caminibacter mediatlanticus]QCT94632.1 anticodon nuclease [Caminibacter mediatlanticus TB-2]